MPINSLLPLVTACVSGVFTLFVADQFVRRRRPYQAVWTFGLLLYAIAAFAQFLGSTYGWRDDLLFVRLWYVCGAIGTAAFLGMGSLFLVAANRPRFARAALIILCVAFAVAAVLVFTAPISAAGLPASAADEINTKQVFPDYVRYLTPIFNIFGAGFLGIGALHSAYVFWRKGIKPFRVVSNCVIAAGAFASSSAGIIVRTGLLTGSGAFSAATLIGVSLIFIGFLISIEVFAEFRIPFTGLILKQRAAPELARR